MSMNGATKPTYAQITTRQRAREQLEADMVAFLADSAAALPVQTKYRLYTWEGHTFNPFSIWAVAVSVEEARQKLTKAITVHLAQRKKLKDLMNRWAELNPGMWSSKEYTAMRDRLHSFDTNVVFFEGCFVETTLEQILEALQEEPKVSRVPTFGFSSCLDG